MIFDILMVIYLIGMAVELVIVMVRMNEQQYDDYEDPVLLAAGALIVMLWPVVQTIVFIRRINHKS